MSCELLTADEMVMRRFDPANRNHFVEDEGNGGQRVRMGAFYLRPGEPGLSVVRRAVLEQCGLSEADVKEPPHVGLAEACVGEIHATEKGLEVGANAWPHGPDPGRPVDEAHALIVPSRPKPTDSQVKALSRCFRIVCTQ